jgi:hypothetical protein
MKYLSTYHFFGCFTIEKPSPGLERGRPDNCKDYAYTELDCTGIAVSG